MSQESPAQVQGRKDLQSEGMRCDGLLLSAMPHPQMVSAHPRTADAVEKHDLKDHDQRQNAV